MDRTRYPGYTRGTRGLRAWRQVLAVVTPGQHPSAQQIMIEAGFITLS